MMLSNMMSIKELSETEYRNKIIYVSFVWALLVVMLHTYNIDTYASSMYRENNILWEITRILENTVTNFARIAVPGFFFLSGYLFYQNFQIQNLLIKWKTRLKTYVIPYLIWTLLPYFFYVMVTHSLLHRYMNMEIVEWSIQRALDAIWTSEFNVLWFLKYLIYYTILAPIFYLLLKNRKVPVGLLTVIALLVLHRLGKMSIINTFYVLGCYIGLNHKKVLHYHHTMFDRISLVLLVVCIISMAWLGKVDCLSQLGIGLVLILFWNVANYLPLNKQPSWYFSISFFVYCTHSMILESIEKLFFAFGKSFVWLPLLDYVLAPICTLTIIYIVANILRRYCLPVWRVVTGERG